DVIAVPLGVFHERENQQLGAALLQLLTAVCECHMCESHTSSDEAPAKSVGVRIRTRRRRIRTADRRSRARRALTKNFVILENEMTAPPLPTASELEILRVIWDRGPSTVREVYRVLSADRGMGYSTVLKFMQIMTEKGTLVRDERVRPQVYQA